MAGTPANRTVSGGLACALGEVFTGPHPLCQAETARICGVPLYEVPLPDYSAYAVWTQASLFPDKKDK